MGLITYSIQAWDDKSVRASFSKDGYKTEIGAKRAFDHYIKAGKYEIIILRKQEYFDGIICDAPYLKYEDGKIYKNLNLRDKDEEEVKSLFGNEN